MPGAHEAFQSYSSMFEVRRHQFLPRPYNSGMAAALGHVPEKLGTQVEPGLLRQLLETRDFGFTDVQGMPRYAYVSVLCKPSSLNEKDDFSCLGGTRDRRLILEKCAFRVEFQVIQII